MTSVLLFLSGFAALLYQVLWMRDLAVLFGSSAQAAAIDLAVFFGGIAAGAALFARFAPRVRNPLRVYGYLELGIGLSALLFFALLHAYGWVYAPLYQRFSERPLILVFVKAVLAIGVLGLPTILMGATLPAMVQHRSPDGERGPEGLRYNAGAWLYGINTAGATLGAFAAGFFLPPTLGFRNSYLLAVAINVAVGVIAILLSRSESLHRTGAGEPRRSSAASQRKPSKHVQSEQAISPRNLMVLAFVSGLLTIGLEVTWLRMFAQVLDNSVYAFSAVMVVALVAFAAASLAIGAARRAPSRGALGSMLFVAGAIVAAEPLGFVLFTDGLTQLQADGWWPYIRQVFSAAVVFVGIPGIAAGMLFPSVLRLVRLSTAAGAEVGRLVFANTAGAIVGALFTTFALLPWLGIWHTLATIGIAYAVLAVPVSAPVGLTRLIPVAPVLALLTTVAIAWTSGALPALRLDPAREERVLGLWEGSHGTVAVTQGTGGRVLRLNNSYSLGGTVDRIERERIQAFIPLVLHPEPKRTFFLGLGTGITAGEAVRHPVERVVVCELVPEVVSAARDYFGEWTRRLDADPRVDIRVEDGRHYLAATDEQFDVIVSDLFVPWHAGTGTLYTREHFEIVRSRLRPGGLFAQWLPLYQLSERDFDTIARTVLDVFPHVVMWRGDFYANRPILALVASTTPMKLDPEAVAERVRRLAPDATEADVYAGVLPFYAGNLSAARQVVGAGPINTDEQPMIEYLSPVAQWGGSGSRGTSWFVGMPLMRFIDRLRESVPAARDPYLAALSSSQRDYVDAGAHYHRAIVERLAANDDLAQRSLAEALDRLPPTVQVSGPFMALDVLVR